MKKNAGGDQPFTLNKHVRERPVRADAEGTIKSCNVTFSEIP